MPSFDRPTDQTIPPSPWVLRWLPLVKPGGAVLDIAAGYGRHARAALKAGLHVVAADVDVSGLADLKSENTADVIEVDLETGDWPFEGRRFDGIIVANYLHRPHLPHLVEGLADDGVLIFETFGQGNEKLGRPRNPEFLLAPGELLSAFSGRLQVIAYEHGEERSPRPAVRQRLCAVKGDNPLNLFPANVQP